MRQSATRRLRPGQWLNVEAGLFDFRHLGRIACVEVVADGHDHVLVQYRGQRHAIPKRRSFIGRGFEPRLIDRTLPIWSTLPADDPRQGTPNGGEPG